MSVPHADLPSAIVSALHAPSEYAIAVAGVTCGHAEHRQFY